LRDQMPGVVMLLTGDLALYLRAGHCTQVRDIAER
jgi:hypothetical protein